MWISNLVEFAMFQQIFKLPNRIVGSVKHPKLSTGRFVLPDSLHSACLLKVNEDAPKTTFRFVHLEIRSNDQPTSDLIENVNQCEDVQDLLDIILPALSDDQSKLGIHQLTVICDRLNELHLRLKPKSLAPGSLKDYYELNDRYLESLKSFKKLTRSSNSIRLLLDRANYLIKNETDKKFLISLLGLLSRIRENSTSPIVKSTTAGLVRLSEDMNSVELIDCLTAIGHYLGDPLACGDLFKFNLKLLKLAKKRILQNELDLNEVALIIRYLYVFLRNENRTDFQVSQYLIERLLSFDRSVLTFDDCVLICRRINQSRILAHLASYRRDGREYENDKIRMAYKVNSVASPTKQTMGECLVPLICRCTEEIANGLSERPTDERFSVFFINCLFTRREMTMILDHFSKPDVQRIVRLSTDFLQNHFDPITHGRLFNDMISFENFLFSSTTQNDASVVRLLYERFCSNENWLHSQLNVCRAYTMLTRNRYPFVDYQLLANRLMSSVEQLRKSLNEDDLSYLHLLTRLVLCDVNDEKMYDLLGELAPRLNADSYLAISYFQYRKIALTNAYLSTSLCKLNYQLKAKLQRILTDSLEAIRSVGRKPTIQKGISHSKRTASKIQENGYLSNGILLSHFGIFDRSIGELVPLDEYTDHFDSVDLIPLTDQQHV